MGYEQIIYDVADGVATITLNRPDKLNAFTGTMMQEMIAAFDETDSLFSQLPILDDLDRPVDAGTTAANDPCRKVSGAGTVVAGRCRGD